MEYVKFRVVHAVNEKYGLEENCMYLADKFDRMCDKLDSKIGIADFSGMTRVPDFVMSFYVPKKFSGDVMKYICNNLGGDIKEISVKIGKKAL